MMLHLLRRRILFAALLTGTGGAAHAATLTVTTSNEAPSLDTDDCSPANGDATCATLRGAINHARNGDAVVFAQVLDGQTITLTRYTNCLTVDQDAGATCLPPVGGWNAEFVEQFGPSAFYLHDKSITIDATANELQQGVVIERSASAAGFRLFDVGGDAGLTLRGLTLRRGYAHGGGSVRGGGAMGAGGAIFNRGKLVAEACTLEGNTAEGGSIKSEPTNQSFGGGGVGQARTAGETADLWNGGGPNAPSGFGGGGGRVLFHGGGFGGGAATPKTRPPQSRFASITVSTQGFGGGTVPGKANGGGFGGGSGYLPPSVPDSSGSWGGGGAGMGGAIFNDAGTVTLRNSTLTGNRASGGGGGLATYGYKAGVGGDGIGGALLNYSGRVGLEAVTVEGNSAVGGSPGGSARSSGIYSLSDGDCSSGGNIYCTDGDAAALVMERSLVESLRMNRIGEDPGATAASGSNNLLKSEPVLANGADASALTYALAENFKLNDLPQTRHGGIVDVRVPQLDSPAVDAAGVCDGVDQRGWMRPQGAACDAGAVEREVVRTEACRVKAFNPSPGDGMTWATAYPDLQTALRDASCTEIWVAGGVYKPAVNATDRTASFVLDRTLKLYGGFVGDEDRLDQRDPGANVTILSGDIDDNDTGSGGISETASQTRGSNSYHVVTIDAGTANAQVDGFVVTAGRASGGDATTTGRGAGLYVLSGHHVALHDLRVVGNRAYLGGGLYLASTSPDMDGLEISGNLAVAKGGGLYCDGGNGGACNPTLTNVTFSGNSASGDSSHATSYGGAMYNDSQYGGSSSPALANVTFSDNSADVGGALYNFASGSNPVLINVILWGDTAASGPEVFNSSGTTRIDHSVVQDGCPAGSSCTNLVTADPRLGPLVDNGGFTRSHLPGPGSPAIDAGTGTGAPDHDQRGVERAQGAKYDIGAVEVREAKLAVSVAGAGGSVSAHPSPAANGPAIAACTSSGGTCLAYYSTPPDVAPALEVTLTAAPDMGNHAVWSGDCTVEGSVTLDADKTCAARFAINQHSIGGMVSGLAGDRVVLSLNGTQSVTVAANGAFAFPDPLDYGAVYNVTVTTQPMSPAQICTIANASGTLPNADVTNVAVICATDTYTVTTSVAVGNGRVEPPTASVAHGGIASFTLMPDTGWHTDSASGCNGSLSDDTYTTGRVTADCTVTARFAIDRYTVDVDIEGGHGTVTPPQQTVDYGARATFVLVPDTNYALAGAGGCGGALVDDAYTTGPITDACTITVHYASTIPPSVSVPMLDRWALLLLGGLLGLIGFVRRRRA